MIQSIGTVDTNIKNPGGASFLKGLGLPLHAPGVPPTFAGEGVQFGVNSTTGNLERWNGSVWVAELLLAAADTTAKTAITLTDAKLYSDSNTLASNTRTDGLITSTRAYVDSQTASLVSGVRSTTVAGSPVTGIDIYRAYDTGTYTNFLAGLATPIVIDSADIANGYADIVRQGTYFIKKPGAISLAAYVNKTTDFTKITGKNLYRTSYLLQDRAVATNGALATLTGSRAIDGIPVVAGQFYTVSGYLVSSSKNLAFTNSSGTPVEFPAGSGVYRTTLFAANTVVQAPTGAAFMRLTIALVGESDSTYINFQVEKGTTATPYQAPVDYISYVAGNPIQALQIAADSTAPDPVSDLNVVNKRYFDRVALKESNLTIVFSPNLADPYYLVPNRYVNNIGARTVGAGWTSISIPVTPGVQYTFGRFTISSGGYYAYYDSIGNFITGSVAVVNNGLLPITTTAPAGAAFLDIDVGRPGDTAYTQLTINLGNTLIAYESAQSFVTKINRYVVGGGGGSVINSFFDIKDVPPFMGNEGKALKYAAAGNLLETFVPLISGGEGNFTRISATAISFMIPVGATRPGGVLVGDGWLDSSTSASDPFLRVRAT